MKVKVVEPVTLTGRALRSVEVEPAAIVLILAVVLVSIRIRALSVLVIKTASVTI